MNKQLETVLIGGSGKTGKRVEKRLRARGVPVRVASRSAAIPFDWADESTWERALEGARALYITFYPDLAVPWAAERVGKLARLATERGAERLVLLSGRGEHQVWPAERAVREAGAAFTIVRSAFFCQNFSEGALLDSVLAGDMAFPAAQVREPFVDAEDIADVVTAALVDARHEGQIYDLTGPRLLTFHDAAAEISKFAARPVRYTPVSGEAYGEMLAPYLPAPEVAFLVELFGMLLDGHNALLTDGVARALGRPPRDFTEFAQSAASAWR
jgi:uncharacterized protein YbjT (DUF2867 family)